MEQVFVATDAQTGFRQKLRALVKESLYFFDADDGAVLPTKPGQELLITMQVLSKAKHFVGSEGSAFSALVRRERLRLGQSKKTSEEVFCEALTKDSAQRRCAAKEASNR
mmetsp:Transcript_35173/g.63904  ORF Transcript_35173/g.63904 Transcript_35173/m.63904 type:complete len:110 (+) Transcript_35173:1-330(+)